MGEDQIDKYYMGHTNDMGLCINMANGMYYKCLGLHTEYTLHYTHTLI